MFPGCDMAIHLPPSHPQTKYLLALPTHITQQLLPWCHRLSAAAFCLTAASLTLAQTNPSMDATKTHHTRDGFKNNYIGTVNKGFGELVRWQIERRSQGLPLPADAPTPVQTPDFGRINSYKAGTGSQANSPPVITWIGHASMLVQSGGLNILTDPVFSNRASPIQLIGPARAQPPGVAVADLPPIDVVVISHNHYDHLDRQSVLDIAQRAESAGTRTLFLVPLGMRSWFVDLGLTNTREMDWWDTHTDHDVTFTFTPTQHWSARGIGDRSQTLWGGWAVTAPDLHWYFAGDTGYSKDFVDTAARFAPQHTAAQGGGFDLALIPVGGYQPRWFLAEQHVNPDEAVQMHLDLRAKRSVGIHWGTFALTDEPLDQPPKDLAAARLAKNISPSDFSVMAIGETRVLTPRTPPTKAP